MLILLAALVAAPWPMHVIDDSSRGADGVRLFDIDGDGRQDIACPWEEGGVVRLYRNPGPDQVTSRWPTTEVGRVASPEDAFCVDLDGDGHCEVVSCCEGDQRQLFIHRQADLNQSFEQSTWITQSVAHQAGLRQPWMYAIAGQWDLDRGLDLIAGSRGANASVTLFRHRNAENDTPWIVQRLRHATWIMSLLPIDMDDDGDQDVLLSDRRGKQRGIHWLENPGATAVNAHAVWQPHNVGATHLEVMFLRVGDIDGDGTREIVAATNAGQLICFQRVSRSATATNSTQSWQAWTIALPAGHRRGKSVAVGDIDRDGRTDLVVSTEDGCVAWMRYARRPTEANWTVERIHGSRGWKYDLVELIDLDEDGDLDVLTCEERHNLGVVWYENQRARGDDLHPVE